MNRAYLVDAHTLLWAADQSDLLSETARSILNQPDNLSFVSVVLSADSAFNDYQVRMAW